jgi:hypothetical protein
VLFFSVTILIECIHKTEDLMEGRISTRLKKAGAYCAVGAILAAGTVMATPKHASAQAAKPNILFILTDNLSRFRNVDADWNVRNVAPGQSTNNLSSSGNRLLSSNSFMETSTDN